MSLHGYSGDDFDAGTENYQVWSCAMLLALEGKNTTGFIDGSYKRSNTDEVLRRQWDRDNAVVLGWILNSISEELFLGQFFSKKAKHVWEELKETYDKVDDSMTFSLHHKIHTLSQNGSSIAAYYHKLNALSQTSAFTANVLNRGSYQRPLITSEDHLTISSSRFSDEQLSTLISLIKENSINGKGVQANMAVTHPNGTKAFITKIRNMPLTDYLTLFDVLVDPEYYVSLLSVHKDARDSKLIIAFDELKCYILNQDLRAGKILRTGRQFGGLYYFDGNQGRELESSYINNNDKSDVMCDICQRAKQTRDPFPLSDHISTEIGALVHLDLWGPYKERSDPNPNRYGTPSLHSGSTFEPLNESEGGHSQGSNGAASEDERSVNHEDNQNVISEDNYCFAFVLNKSFEPKSFEEAAKHQPWVDAMNSEMCPL
ncbi:ribonuclease H-like domain-containing protein [Tanacetum coccineum]